jgi:hypothetical protein
LDSETLSLVGFLVAIFILGLAFIGVMTVYFMGKDRGEKERRAAEYRTGEEVRAKVDDQLQSEADERRVRKSSVEALKLRHRGGLDD